MAIIEYTCPVTGERTRFRFQGASEACPAQSYSAGATTEQIDAFEKANPKATKLRRHAHQTHL